MKEAEKIDGKYDRKYNRSVIRIRIALLASSIASFLTPFMGSSINVALPAIAQEFKLDAISLNWVATSFILSAAMFLVPFGRIADIHGRKRIFITGTLLFTISSILCMLSFSGRSLIIFRFFQGIGSAMIFGTAIAIITSVFPPQERGKALGINIAAVYMGLSLGPFLGGILTQHLGWRSIFIAVVCASVVSIFAITKIKGEWAEAKGEKFDFPGSVIYGFSLFTLIYAFSLLPEKNGLILFLSSFSGIALFTWYESRKPSPVLEIKLFRRNIVFAFSNLAALIHYCATFAVAFLLSLYLQYIRNFSPQDAGIVLLIQPLIMVILSPFAGWLSDRVEPRIVASAGMSLTTIALAMFTALDKFTDINRIIAILVLLGSGFALFSSPNTNAVMSSVERKFYSIASATLGTMRLIGQMLSMGIVMLIFALYIGKVQITPEYYTSFIESVRISFAIFSSLCFAGIFASLARGRIRS